MSNKAASLTGALLSGKDGAAHTLSTSRVPSPQGPAAPPAAAEGGDALRQFSLPLDCLEEGRTSGQGCVAATFSSAKSERAQ